MNEDKRIIELTLLTAISGGMFFPVYDPGTDITYRVALSSVIPSSTNEDYTWNPNIEYVEDDIVSRSAGPGLPPQLYISLQNANTGNLPEEPGSLFWTLAVQAASGIAPWVASIFTDLHPIVLHDNGNGVSLYYLSDPTRPFNSTNITNEINNGLWTNLSDGGRKLKTANIAGAFTQLDMGMMRERTFKPSGDISAGVGNEFIFSNDDNAVHATVIFTITGLPVLIFPLNTKMSDARWNPVDVEFTPLDAGTYKMTMDFDGVSWFVDISQAPYD